MGICGQPQLSAKAQLQCSRSQAGVGSTQQVEWITIRISHGFPSQLISIETNCIPPRGPLWRWPQEHHHFPTSLQNAGLQNPFSAEICSRLYPKAPTLLLGVLLYQFSNTAPNPYVLMCQQPVRQDPWSEQPPLFYPILTKCVSQHGSSPGLR